MRGARAIAEETRYFMDRIAVTATVFVDGGAGAVIAPGGHPYAVLRFRFRGATITNVDITPYAADEVRPVLHGTGVAASTDRWPAPG